MTGLDGDGGVCRSDWTAGIARGEGRIEWQEASDELAASKKRGKIGRLRFNRS